MRAELAGIEVQALNEAHLTPAGRSGLQQVADGGDTKRAGTHEDGIFDRVILHAMT